MIRDTETLEQVFYQVFKLTTKKIVKNWIKLNSNRLSGLQENCVALANSLSDQKNFNLPITKIISFLEKSSSEMLIWIQSINWQRDEIFKNDYLDEWNSAIQKNLESIPKKLQLTINDNFWEPQQDDLLKIRTWRWIKRARNQANRNRLETSNKIRKIFQKDPLTTQKHRRRFLFHNFVFNYIGMPVSNSLFREWQHFLHQSAIQIYNLHIETEALKNSGLYKQNSTDTNFSTSGEDIENILSLLRNQLEKVLNIFETFKNFPKEAGERLENDWSEIMKNVVDKWQFAGTFILPNKRFNNNRINKERERLQQISLKNKKLWQIHFDGEFEEWQKDVELSMVQLQASKICLDTISLINQRIEKNIVPAFSDTIQILNDQSIEFEKADTTQPIHLQKIILKARESITGKLKQEQLPVIIDALVKLQIETIFQNYNSRIRKILDILSEEHKIFQNRDISEIPPKSRMNIIPFRSLVLEDAYLQFVLEHEANAEELHQISEEIFRDVSEIDQIVEYNFETASNMLQENINDEITGADAHKVITEGLKRALNKVRDLVQKNTKIGEKASDEILQTTIKFIDHIQALENTEKILELRLRFARAKAKEKYKNSRELIWKKAIDIFSRIQKSIPNVVQKIISMYSRVRRMTGLAPTEREIEEKLTRFLLETQKRMRSLPYVYQHLFHIEPLSDNRFFLGRVDEHTQLHQLLLNWQNEHYSAIAIIGEKGSGRTTIINIAEQQFLKNFPITKINLEETCITSEKALFVLLKDALKIRGAKSIDDLEKRILDSDERKIFIFENIQNLFIRTVDGFQALERFLLFVARTDKIFFWITTCTIYSWNYLNKVLQISKYFRKVIEIVASSQEEIENIIMKRHRISGYQLHFETPSFIGQSRKFKKISAKEKQQLFIKDYFFEQLNKLAAGNVTVAMLFWQSAIKSITQNRMIISPTIDLDFSFLHQLNADELFTLASLLQHETLSAEEHSKIFHQELQQSLLLLDRLCNKKIILKLRGRYQVHYLLYRPIVAVLKIKNIIH